MNWRDLLQSIQALSAADRTRLLSALDAAYGVEDQLASRLAEIREARFAGGVECPHCESKSPRRNGTYRGRQRYLCRCCGRTFNDLTATPLAGTHYPDLWLRYLEAMAEGRTLPKLAEELGIHVSTAFHWRHKILRAARKLAKAPGLTGIVEADETYFLESMKGRRKVPHRPARKRGGKAAKRGISREQIAVMAAVERGGGIVCRKAGYGRLTVDEIEDVLGPALQAEAMLCTDAASGFVRFAAKAQVEHQIIASRKGRPVNKGIFHLQHVNGFHSRLKTWMVRFHGVATRYLDNYLTWFRALELAKPAADREKPGTILRAACRGPLRTTSLYFRAAQAA